MRSKEESIRDRRRKTVRTYLNEYRDKNNTPDISVLCKSAQHGDLNAMKTLVNTHRHLVKTIAIKYQNMGLGLDDLKRNGNIGLIKAIHRFNKSRSVEFSTYAIWWIRQSIMKAIGEEMRINQISEFGLSDLWVVSNSFNSWEKLDDSEPTIQQIDKFLESGIYELAMLNPAEIPTRYNWLPKA